MPTDGHWKTPSHGMPGHWKTPNSQRPWPLADTAGTYRLSVTLHLPAVDCCQPRGHAYPLPGFIPEPGMGLPRRNGGVNEQLAAWPPWRSDRLGDGQEGVKSSREETQPRPFAACWDSGKACACPSSAMTSGACLQSQPCPGHTWEVKGHEEGLLKGSGADISCGKVCWGEMAEAGI